MFNKTIQATDNKYAILRDNPDWDHLRELVDRMWIEYEPYADNSFRSDIAYDFHPRFWEMYLCFTLLKLGFKFVPRKVNSGPDLQIIDNKMKIWMEATAPDAGSGDDAVPQPVIGKVSDVPREKMILRLTNSISKKYEQFQKFRDKGIVTQDDPFIIAINGSQIPHCFLENEIPMIVQSVLPFGNLSFTIDLKSNTVIDSFFKYRDSIIKNSGAFVSTKIFLDPSYSGISGILYSNSDLWNLPTVFGSEFIFIHNPNAKNKLPHDWISTGVQYWVEDNQLKRSGGA